MKFIELHRDSIKFWIDIDKIVLIEESGFPDRPSCIPDRPSCIRFVDNSDEYFIETPEEILQKIAEAEQRDTVPTGFMDDWKKEVDEQLGRLTIRKDVGNEGDIV